MRRLRACVPVRPHVEVEDRAVLAMTYAATLPHYYFKSRCFFLVCFGSGSSIKQHLWIRWSWLYTYLT